MMHGFETIYAVLDHDLNVRYVGRTSRSLVERLARHTYGWKHSDTPIAQWTRANKGGFFLQALELTSTMLAGPREYEWIRKFRALGYDILNILPPIDPLYYIERSRALRARQAAQE